MLGYLLVFIGAITTVLADYLAKRWSETAGLGWIPAVILYAVTGAVFVLSLKFGELTIMNAFWSVLVFITTSAVGLFIFHERLSPVQTLALILGFASIALFLIDEVWGSGAHIK